MNLPDNPFISFLIEEGKVKRVDLEKILSSKESSEDLSIEEYLLSSRLLTEDEFRSSLEEFYGVPLVTKEDFPEEPVLVNTLPIQFMKESKFIPARLIDKELTVIMSNPLDFYTIDAIRLATHFEIRVLLGQENEILGAIERSYASGASSMEKIIEDIVRIPE